MGNETTRRVRLPRHAERLRERLARPPRPWEEIVYVVGSAVVLSLLLDALIDPPADALELTARVTGSLLRIALAVLFGMWLGKRAWPKRGLQLGRLLLRRATQGRARPILYLTDRPDFEPSTARRIFDAVGFAAGASILVTALLAIVGASRLLLSVPTSLFVILALWGSFVLVPYWTFGRMGIRRVDPVRWLVEPLGRRYAARLRLSNGALLFIALTITANLAFRAGAAGDDALLGALRYVGHLVAAILVVSAAGVAYYARAERGVFLALEQEALARGIKDGRGMSDGDFLPRGT